MTALSIAANMKTQAMTNTLSPFLPGKSGRRRGAMNDDVSANPMKTSATTASPILWPVESPASSTGLFHHKALVAAAASLAQAPEQRGNEGDRADDDQGVEHDRALQAEEADRGVHHPAEPAVVVRDGRGGGLRAQEERDARRRAGRDRPRARVEALGQSALRLGEPDLQNDALRVRKRRALQGSLERDDGAPQLRDLRRLELEVVLEVGDGQILRDERPETFEARERS